MVRPLLTVGKGAMYNYSHSVPSVCRCLGLAVLNVYHLKIGNLDG